MARIPMPAGDGGSLNTLDPANIAANAESRGRLRRLFERNEPSVDTFGCD